MADRQPGRKSSAGPAVDSRISVAARGARSWRKTRSPRKGRVRREKREGEDKKREAKKEERKPEGEILLVVQNVTPEQISLRSSKNEMLLFHLSDEAFSHGEFKYDLVVEAKKAGKVEVKGYVIPFLAPIAGQEFSLKAGR